MDRTMKTVFCFLLAAPLAAQAAPAAPALVRVESVDDCIARGREALRAKKPDEAVRAFEQAAQLDGSTPKTRVWLVRGWIALGKFDDALQAVDELTQAKAPASDTDYLLGLAFFGQAKKSAAQGGGQYTQGQFEDATASLQRALKADATRYGDAWVALAEAAWYAQKLDVARDAAEHAVALEPKDPAAQIVLGKVAFAQFSAAQSAEDKTGLDEHWNAALAAFTKAIEALGRPSGAAEIAQLGDAHLQAAYLYQWKQDAKNAAANYAIAASLNPAAVDFNQVHGGLGAEFESCLADALAKFHARYGEANPSAATLHWWYGFALFENAKMPASEEQFRRAVQLFPAYTNSWYYVFRAKYSQQEYEEAVAALKTNWRLDPDGLAASLGGDRTLNLPIVEYLVGWCVDPAQHDGEALNADAALLSEMLTRTVPDEARYWNNLGLFLRDEGDALRQKNKNADAAELQKLWEGAYAAYSKTLELQPNNPNYLNDTAVMLHYYLKRDYDKALAMYQKAAKSADELLARKDLRPDEREVIQIAKRDSNNNIVKVKRIMEKLAKGEKPGKEDEDQ
jgi:Tfp pilus assembly protein PilF